MSTIIERNKTFLVKSEYGTYNINNRKTAEQLNQTLTNYEIISKQSQATEKTLDRVTKQVIQLQMTLTIMQNDLDKIKKELNI
jgi:septal ring factor EnvC (AmiA/AmiB activator)